jgi:uncharacterized protein with GYD domain
MPKFLVEASYTAEGLKGLKKDTAAGRKKSIGRAMEALGGHLECMYFVLGDRDVIGVADLPDHVTAASFSLNAGSSGLLSIKTTALLTPEEVDQAFAKKGAYKPPGQVK